MIYTVTLNPALDRIIQINDLKPDDSNKIVREEKFAGGKGIDVSKVITELGGVSTALGFMGGFDGLELEGLLINNGVICDFTKISNEIRTNIIIQDIITKKQTSLNSKGPGIKPHELAEFFDKINSIDDAEFMVISGSVPLCINSNIYNQIINLMRKKGVKVSLDADGEVFKQGIKAKPYMIKPNKHEFSRLIGEDVSDIDDVVFHARHIVNTGISLVIVSLGADGIVAATKKKALYLAPPKVDVVNKIGAGDSLVAGIVHGMTNGESLEEALTLGVASGTATTMVEGTALCRKADVMKLKDEITIEEH
jgi:6-phosphofructokinase 2